MSVELSTSACELFPARRTSLFDPGFRDLCCGGALFTPHMVLKIVAKIMMCKLTICKITDSEMTVEREWNPAP